MNKVAIAKWSTLPDRVPTYALVANVDLVVVRYGDEVSVLFGRCLHRGALLADGSVDGDNLICGVHNWDYRIQTGISEYNNHEVLRKFRCWIEDGALLVDQDEIAAWEKEHPQPYRRDVYQGLYADVHGDPVEPHVQLIQKYATEGLSKTGHHGVVEAMGVPRQELPSWDDIQIITAQLATPPQLDDAEVGTEVVVGPNAQKPLRLKIPLLVSDMSFGSLSEPAKVALAKGPSSPAPASPRARAACWPTSRPRTAAISTSSPPRASAFPGTSCSRSRPFISRAARAPRPEPAATCRARKSSARSPSRAACRKVTTRSRRRASPIGLKSPRSRPSPTRCATTPAASRSATSSPPSTSRRTSMPRSTVGCDYVIIDGRGGATGAAPRIFRDNISVPTIPALARARRHLDKCGREDVTLIITGGLRTPADFAKALALGADAVAVANAAIQAIGCLGMRACHTNNCPVGIATQKPHLVARLIVDEFGAAPGAVPGNLGRADEDPGARLRPHPPQSVLARRSRDLERGHVAARRHTLWRRGAGVAVARMEPARAASPRVGRVRCPLQSQPAQSVTRYRRPMTELLCAPADATDEANWGERRAGAQPR